MQGGACGHALLRGGHAEQREDGDFDQREDGPHDGHGGHGHHHIIFLLLLLAFIHGDGAGQAHDGGRTADTGTAGGQDGKHRANLERASQQIGDHDGQGHDHGCDGQALDALGEQHLQVELEPKQDNTQAQQLVGDQSGGVLHPSCVFSAVLHIYASNRELDDHTENQSENQCAEQRKARESLEPRSNERQNQRDDGNEQHIDGGDAIPPFHTELSHGFVFNTRLRYRSNEIIRRRDTQKGLLLFSAFTVGRAR